MLAIQDPAELFGIAAGGWGSCQCFCLRDAKSRRQQAGGRRRLLLPPPPQGGLVCASWSAFHNPTPVLSSTILSPSISPTLNPHSHDITSSHHQPQQVLECDNPEHGRDDWDACPFAHPGEVVTRRPPQTHLPKLCPKARRACRKGRACAYAHNVFEHWLHPSRFKTEPCANGARCGFFCGVGWGSLCVLLLWGGARCCRGGLALNP